MAILKKHEKETLSDVSRFLRGIAPALHPEMKMIPLPDTVRPYIKEGYDQFCRTIAQEPKRYLRIPEYTVGLEWRAWLLEGSPQSRPNWVHAHHSERTQALGFVTEFCDGGPNFLRIIDATSEEY